MEVGVFVWCVQATDSDGLLYSSRLQFCWVLSVKFFGNSKRLQRHDSVHLSSVYIDYSFSSVPPVLWTTSCLPINGSYGAWLIRRIHKVTHRRAEAGRSVMPTIVLSTFAAIRRYAAVAAAPIGLLPLRVLLDSCFFLRCHDNRRTLVTCNICATSAQQ